MINYYFYNFQDDNYYLRKMVNNKPYEEYRDIENYKPIAIVISFSAIIKKFSNEK